MHRTSLRWRIMLALVLIVTVTSTLFAVGVLLIKEKLEQVIFDDMVREQLQELLAQVENGTYAADELFKNWTFYYGAEAATIHPTLRALPPGSHHGVRLGERYLQVEAGSRNGQPVYLTYDITDWENQEHELLILLSWGIGIVLLAAILMGRQASTAILAPVRALTERLSTIQPRQRNIRIAQDFQGNEIDQIAHAFDLYLERLDQFVERERSFTAAASHELRTPLSVMMGAVDVLDTHEQHPVALRALARLKRACGEMRAFIEATLFLSREDSSTIHEGPPANLAEIVKDLLEDNHSRLQERNIRVATEMADDFLLEQPVSIIQIMVGNILRNAIEHTRDGSIRISTSGNSLSVRDSGSGIPTEDLPKVFDRSYTTKKDGIGLGLNLVKRICDRFDWRIEISSRLQEGTVVNIHF